jgi:hypothetical protein
MVSIAAVAKTVENGCKREPARDHRWLEPAPAFHALIAAATDV